MHRRYTVALQIKGPVHSNAGYPDYKHNALGIHLSH